MFGGDDLIGVDVVSDHVAEAMECGGGVRGSGGAASGGGDEAGGGGLGLEGFELGIV